MYLFYSMDKINILIYILILLFIGLLGYYFHEKGKLLEGMTSKPNISQTVNLNVYESPWRQPMTSSTEIYQRPANFPKSSLKKDGNTLVYTYSSELDGTTDKFILKDSSNGLYDGNINSKKIIVKFFDYNCSYCKKAHTDIQKLLEKEDVKVVYKNFPILSENSVFLAKLGILFKLEILSSTKYLIYLILNYPYNLFKKISGTFKTFLFSILNKIFINQL